LESKICPYCTLRIFGAFGTTRRRAVDIQEDETGVYVYENNLQIILAESPITLPTFSDKKFFCIKNIAS
jgi:hypothetical protein